MLGLETDIPTLHGLVKLKDLKEEDLLFDENGNTCNIINFGQVFDAKSYRVIFDDDSTINVCENHFWLTWNKKARKSYAAGDSPTFHPLIRSTKEILETLKTKTSKVETNHSIACASPTNYSYKDLIIDPYVLGCWLGDGTSNSGSIECANEEILAQIRAAGYSVSMNSANSKSKSSGYRVGDIVSNDGGPPIGLLKKQLKSINLIDNKHIPDNYLQSDPDQRLALLQGLMDTDGCCTVRDSRMEFCSVIPLLASQVFQLVSSLGIKATIHKNESFCRGKKCQDRYRISFITKKPIFRLSRKLANIKMSKAQDNRNTHRYIVNIQRMDPVQMRGINVDSQSNLFLVTKNFIPTHNSKFQQFNH
jgi:serine/threonine protein kinase